MELGGRDPRYAEGKLAEQSGSAVNALLSCQTEGWGDDESWITVRAE
jgi:hypothetical protein